MAKSSRRRKQDRNKRQKAKAQREAAAAKRRSEEAAWQEAERHVRMMSDPETPLADLAEAVRAGSQGEPVGFWLAKTISDARGSTGDVVEVAELLTELEAKNGSQTTRTALTFCAHAAYLAGDFGKARRLIDQLDDELTEATERLEMAIQLSHVGRPADALDILEPLVVELANDPDDFALYGYSLEQAQRRSDHGVEGPCPCGSGDEWTTCCKPREAVALRRFMDRSGIYALREAVDTFLPTSTRVSAICQHVDEWLTTARADAWDPPAGNDLEGLAIEHALIAAATDPDDLADDDVLTDLAAAPETSPDIARHATAWHNHVRYGLWTVRNPRPSPGLWLTDLCSGQGLYAAFAPEQIEILPRWSVLLGALVPVDGAWRSAKTLINVTPTEADAMLETIFAATEVVVSDMADRPTSTDVIERLDAPVPFGTADPHGVYSEIEDPRDPLVAEFIGRVVGSLMPRLLGELHTYRSTPPTMVNTDGDVMSMITTRIAVNDAGSAVATLAARPDFERTSSGLTWFGLEVPAARRDVMRAELVAQGHELADEDPSAPQRWVRGTLRVDGDEIVADVNSEKRLDRLVKILGRVGAEPDVVDTTRLDPAMDMAWPTAHRPKRGGLAPATEGWEKAWLSENVPALGALTPPEAARSVEYEPVLETMLRQLEYDADALAAAGDRGVDVAWLREQLDMPDEWRD